MQDKIFAVLDTNVLVSALFSRSGESTPARVVRKVIDGTITPLYNADILYEYRTVLARDKFPFRKHDINFLIGLIKEFGIEMERTNADGETFIDKDDIVFYEIALSHEDSFLVTGNKKHFPKKPFVVSPAEMMEIIHALENPHILSERRYLYSSKY